MGAPSTNHAITTLERLIAENVLGTLVARQHLRVASGSTDSLRAELETAVVPLLSSVTPYLMAAHATVGDCQDGFNDRNADEAVAVMIDTVGERLAHSNHIDDIFVDDATLRRDSLRAARHVLLRYMRGELEIEADVNAIPSFVIALEALGYVVAAAAARLPEPRLTRALMHAGKKAGTHLEHYDAATRRATFGAGNPTTSLLSLEDAVTAQIVSRVESGEVALPCVEQVFELPAARRGRGVVAAALREAAAVLERRSPCRATCEKVGTKRIRLAVTPLTDEAAQHVDAYFEELVALVEAALDAAEAAPVSSVPESAPAISETRRRRANTSKALANRRAK